MQLLNEAIRSKDFNSAQAIITKYLRSKLGNKVYAYPAPEVFKPASGTQMVGIRFFIMDGGAKSLRMNWKTVGKIGSQGLASISYWDGSKNPQPYPSHEIKLNHETSLVKVLPMVVDLIHGGLEKSGFYINESVQIQHMPIVTDFRAVSELNEASYSTGEISKTVHNVIGALKMGVSPGDQYKAGGPTKYGAGWGKVIEVIKSQYPSVFGKSGVKVMIDQSAAGKIDAAKVIAMLGGDPDVVQYSVHPGAKEEVEVEGASETDIERLTYEEQLDSQDCYEASDE